MKPRTWFENLRWSWEKLKKKKKMNRENENQVIKIKRKEYYLELQTPRSRKQSLETEKQRTRLRRKKEKKKTPELHMPKGWEGKKKKMRLKRHACVRQSKRERRELKLSEVNERVTEWGRVTAWAWAWDESEAESLRSNEAWDWECLGVRTLGLVYRLLTKTM